MRICIVRSLQGKAARVSLGCHTGVANVAEVANEDNQYCCVSEGRGA